MVQTGQKTTEKSGTSKKFSGKKWGIIGGIAVILIALIIGIGIYNSPSNQLSRQLDLGNRYLEEQNYEQAVLAFDKAIEIDPMNVEAYLGKAQAYAGMGDVSMAIQALEEGYERTGDERLLEEMQRLDRLDPVIEWEDAAFEALIREYLGKSEGDIRESEVCDIESIRIIGIYIEMPDEDIGGLGSTRGGHSESGAGNGIVYDHFSYQIDSDKRHTGPTTVLGNIETLNDIEHFRAVKSLVVKYNNIIDISALSHLTNLKSLSLFWCNNISDISVLGNLTSLETLSLEVMNISDISALSSLANLTDLSLSDNYNIGDISALSSLTNLRRLSLDNNNISDISVLSSLTNLERLSLKENNISDISVLSNLTNLKQLDLQYNNINDYSPVSFVEDLYY